MAAGHSLPRLHGLGRYDEAIAACEKSVREYDWWNAKLLKQRPGISIADFKALRLSNNPTFLQQTETHLFAGLRKTGIPEK